MPDRTLSFTQSLALTAVVASLATTSVLLTYQSLRRDAATERLKRQVGGDVEEWEAKHSEEEDEEEGWVGTPVDEKRRWVGEYDEGLVREQVSPRVHKGGEGEGEGQAEISWHERGCLYGSDGMVKTGSVCCRAAKGGWSSPEPLSLLEGR